MKRQRALRLAREWAQGHRCSLRDGEAAGYHSMFATMLEESMSNEPLTLEQLREMKGQPVWTVTTGIKGSGRWELVCNVDYEDVLEMESCVDGFYYIEVNTYGSTWNAYRRPPEGEEEA